MARLRIWSMRQTSLPDPREIPLRTGKCETHLGAWEEAELHPSTHFLLGIHPLPQMLTSDGHLPMPCTPLSVLVHHLAQSPWTSQVRRGRLREGVFTQDSHNWKTVPVFFPSRASASSMIPTCPHRAHFYFEAALNLNLGKLQEMVSDREAQGTTVHVVGEELDTTWQLYKNNNVIFQKPVKA